jgi:hypothetical protein
MHSQTVTLVVAIGLMTYGVPSAQHPKRAMSVCELLRNAHNLEGQIVSVHGILQDSDIGIGPPYFDELAAENCAGAEANQQIQVVSPDSHFLANPPRGFNPDPASVRRVEDALAKMQTTGRPVNRLSATVEGVLCIPQPDSEPPGSNRPRHKRYPAYIVIQALRDVQFR